METFVQFLTDHQAAMAALAVHFYHSAQNAGGVKNLWLSFWNAKAIQTDTESRAVTKPQQISLQTQPPETAQPKV
jgi:hypothetical protein